jgi:acylphosphatase
MRRARRYTISGRVQGVGFRFFTHAAAARDGVHGWARNLPDGRVEVWAEGEHEALERFEQRLRIGPPAARVDSVDVADEAVRGDGTGFSIR